MESGPAQITLNEEQIATWVQLVKNHEFIRKWSDESKSAEDVAAIIVAMEARKKEM